MDVPYCLQASATSKCMRPCRVLRIIHNLDHAATGGPGNWRSRRYDRSDCINQRAMGRVATQAHRVRDGTRESPILWPEEGTIFQHRHNGSQRNEQWDCQMCQKQHADHQLTWRLHRRLLVNGGVLIRYCTATAAARRQLLQSDCSSTG